MSELQLSEVTVKPVTIMLTYIDTFQESVSKYIKILPGLQDFQFADVVSKDNNQFWNYGEPDRCKRCKTLKYSAHPIIVELDETSKIRWAGKKLCTVDAIRNKFFKRSQIDCGWE